MNARWYVRICIEKNGKYGEFDGLVDTAGSGEATAAGLEAEVKGRIINQEPHLKGGRVTHCEIRKMG